ncbi:MAG: pitrilysin family protein [Phycisphaerales bacterium]|jgi:predicted Zn-dependent peptidase|nr:pitrilysin family protein [Phycisphaerales bacterium]
MKHLALLTTTLFVFIGSSFGQVEPDVFVLDNGMKFILLPRFEEPNSVAAGWVARVGSVNERPGITGMSHFFEHLMFKGTDTVGTSDAVVDSEFTDVESKLRNRMLEIIWGEQYSKFRLGEIDDPWDEKHDTPELSSLRKELKETMNNHRGVIVKDELASLYQSEGAVGLNAFTSEDVTFYINQLPANKLELWCWLESDRLANSVFREFFSERDVVHEERRMRTESSPIGEFQEQFNSMFWQASPYSWPVIGWPSDLNSYTLEEANRYFDIYYQPSNLVGVLVGDFDLETTKKMIVEYFGQLEAGSEPPPVVPTIEPTQKAQQRMLASVAAQSQVEIRYHAVPAGHSDGYALEIMSGVLNGKTGRLYKSMVQGEEIAANTRFVVDTKKYAGAVLFAGTVKGSATPKQLEAAWYEQVSLLQNEPVSKKELEKVKNNVIANQYRQLQSNFYLMIQLGYMEALGDWEYINYSGERLLEITTEDILNVANKYLQPENSSVAIYVRSKDAEPVDEDLERFNPQQQAMIKEALSEFNTMSGEELKAFLEMTKQQASQVPPEYKDVFDYITGKLQEKVQAISEISNGDSGSQD